MNGIKAQSKVSRDPEKQRKIVVGFLNTDKIARKEQKQVTKFNTPGMKTSCVLLLNGEEVRKQRPEKRAGSDGRLKRD